MYFTQDYLTYFTELSQNNNKAWFEENKKRYEGSVKEPFLAFLRELLLRIKSFDPRILQEAKESVFRINRDVRFSADKSPYKTHQAAYISPLGRKDESHRHSGLYLHFAHNECFIAGGFYFLDPKKQLPLVRYAVCEKADEFEELLKEENFVKYFGGVIEGEKNKKTPKGFEELVDKSPYALNKQFYYQSKLSPETIFRPDLADYVFAHYVAARRVAEFLEAALAPAYQNEML